MSGYEKLPVVVINSVSETCTRGWDEIGAQLREAVLSARCSVLVVELYPGLEEESFLEPLRASFPGAHFFTTASTFRSPAELREVFADTFLDDPVFNRMRPASIEAYFDEGALTLLRQRLAVEEGLRIVVGTGAAYVAEQADLLVHAGNKSVGAPETPAGPCNRQPGFLKRRAFRCGALQGCVLS